MNNAVIYPMAAFFYFVPPWQQRAAFTDAARRSLGVFVKLTRKRCASCNIC
ncbi:hypothetical protein PQQ65_23300 [Paraburkholderia strydomiana]|uniref:hypothetical protein n=1 Tax=Paraburkholderia strydomiana TaxID=1245417 RepID=UPI0038BCA8DA